MGDIRQPRTVPVGLKRLLRCWIGEELVFLGMKIIPHDVRWLKLARGFSDYLEDANCQLKASMKERTS